MRLTTVRSTLLASALALGVARAAPPPPAAKPAPAKPAAPASSEDWALTAVLPTDLITLEIHFVEQAGSWHASVDIPYAKIKGLELINVLHDNDHLVFTLKKAGQPESTWETYTLARTGDSAVGKLTVGAQPLYYLKMQRLHDGEALHATVARPQTPQPPYPYGEREVTVNAPEAGHLAGTLTLPTGKGPFPAILLITGSGLQDRDETIFGHRPFRLIADRLTRAGIAVLRFDDRTMGKSTGQPNTLDTDINDALAEEAFLLKQPEVDPKRVGVLGHSVGGAIAAIVAARTHKLAFIVSLAGSALPGAELVPLQIQADLLARGAPADMVTKLAAIQRKLGAVAIKNDPKALRKAVAEAIVASLAVSGQPAPAGAALDAMVNAKLKEVQNPWSMGYLKTNPRLSWRKIKVPVLVLIGGKDTQVPAKENLAAVTAALKKAGDRDVTAREVPGLNHLFQHADTGILDEYGMIEETFDSKTLEDLTAWLVAKAHVQ